MQEKDELEKPVIFNLAIKKDKRVLMLLLSVACLLLMVVMANARVAYAGSETDQGGGNGPTPQWIWPGDGGGTDPIPNTFYGEVYNPTGRPIPAGVAVVLTGGGNMGYAWTTTDSQGTFQIQSGSVVGNNIEIKPNTIYQLLINDEDAQGRPGFGLVDTEWCQAGGWYFTDNMGWANVHIQLQRAPKVNVTFAALYSNTQFATLSYEWGTSTTFNHQLDFNVLIVGVSTGYSVTTSGSYMCRVDGNERIAVQRIFYANAYYDAKPYDPYGTPGVTVAGVTIPDKYSGYYNNPVNEYLSNASELLSTDPSHTFSFGLGPSTAIYGYTETESHTWGVSASPFAILFNVFGNLITMDETVTTTKSTYVKMSVTVPTGYPLINFMAYCPGPPGTSFDPLRDSKDGTGGYELHIWDMSGYG